MVTKSVALLMMSALVSPAMAAGGKPGGGGGGGFSSPRPSYSAPRPSYSAPKPSYSAPKPTYTAPKPTYTAPKPTYTAPKPVNTTPAPKPVNNTPTPRPIDHTPAPKPPVNNTPAPKPVNNQPTPNLKPPTPTFNGHKVLKEDSTGKLVDHGNHTVKYGPDGRKQYMESSGRRTEYAADGVTKTRETRGNTVTQFHNDGSHTVSEAGKVQYTQKTFNNNNNGRTTVQRTYINNNTTVVKNYNVYTRGGYSYHAYCPIVAYDPWFYGYVYRPWYTPYPYTWGYIHDPWYHYYGYYYRPYPVYYSPGLWLTDFLFSEILAAQYRNAAARAAAQQVQLQPAPQPQAQQAPAITQEIKDQIKQQVEEAVRAHEKKESLDVHTALRNPKHMFVLTSDHSVTRSDNNKPCALTQGDIIKAASSPAETDQFLEVIVVKSKAGSCDAGAVVTMSIHDLQEFENGFMETLEKGMDKMKKEVADKQK